MAGLKDFTAEVALSADVDEYLMGQTIQRFADQSAMFAAQSGYVSEGWYAYTLDTHTLWRYDGSAYRVVNSPAVSYTPTWTNLTVGSGVVVARVSYAGEYLRCRGQITFAGDTVVSGTVQQTIPGSITSDAAPVYGAGLLNEAGVAIHPAICAVAPSSTQITWVHAESGHIVNATSPFTWGDTDVLTWDITIGIP